MEILKANQDTLSPQIKETIYFVNLTYVETSRNRLLLHSLQQDIVQMNSTVHCLSKELKALILNRNLFVILFQPTRHLVTLCNGLNSLQINILSIINQVPVISSQKLTPVLLSPCDLTSLFTKIRI